ncbi:hypothetical protein AADZ86_02820 [Colwelliaceae bacterium BS250]
MPIGAKPKGGSVPEILVDADESACVFMVGETSVSRNGESHKFSLTN